MAGGGAAAGTGLAGEVTARWRPPLAGVALLLMIAGLVPPVTTLATRYVVAETAQFAAFAMIIPALLVLSGLAWRPWAAGLAGWLGGRDQPLLRSLAVLVVFGLVVVAWRLPFSVDALAQHPALAPAELASFLITGVPLWLQILPAPPPRDSAPVLNRAVVAIFTMWLIWIIAYILGMAQHGVFHAYRYVPGGALSAMADQELSTAVLWVVAAACFLPVIIPAALRWMHDDGEDADQELGRVTAEAAPPAVRGWGPPRGRRAASR